MSTPFQTAAQLANWRTLAQVLPKRSSACQEQEFSTLSFRIALGIGVPLGGIIMLYFRVLRNADFLWSLAYGGIWALVLVAGVTSFPLWGRFLSFSAIHRAEARNMLLEPRYFFYHACLWLFFVWATLWLMPVIVLSLNQLLALIGELPWEYQSLGIADFYFQWVAATCFILVGHEVYLVVTAWWINRHQKARMKSSSFGVWVGYSTGLLEKRSHGAALKKGQHVTLSLEDAAQNIMILGGIGSGKTSRMINPLLLQLLQQDCGGLIFDIKGDFHLTVGRFATEIGKPERVVRLGIGGEPINLISGLSPDMAASFLKSALVLSGQIRGETFWIDTATQLCLNVLGVLSFLPEKYTLNHLQAYLYHPTAKAAINEALEEAKLMLSGNDTRLLHTYQDYLDHIYGNFDEKTKSGVLATVAQVLSPFRSPILIDAFCQPSPLRMENVLDGIIYLLSLPLAQWGLGGKVVYNFVKLRFFNVMQMRPSQVGTWNQTRPVFFLCDEYQEIATGNKDSLSDLNFWDKSRSSQTVGIISAQSVSSFYAAIGDRDIANTILQNFRQKICFRTEDEATLNYLNHIMGQAEVEKKSTSKQRGASSKIGAGFGSSTHHSRGESVTRVNKSIIDAQLMRNLKPDQAFAMMVIQHYSCDDILETLVC